MNSSTHADDQGNDRPPVWFLLWQSERLLLAFLTAAVLVSWGIWWLVRDHAPAVPELIEEREVQASLNVNTATINELLVLPGIGEKTATAIVAERGRNGPFLSLSDMASRVSRLPKDRLEGVSGFLSFEADAAASVTSPATSPSKEDQ